MVIKKGTPLCSLSKARQYLACQHVVLHAASFDRESFDHTVTAAGAAYHIGKDSGMHDAKCSSHAAVYSGAAARNASPRAISLPIVDRRLWHLSGRRSHDRKMQISHPSCWN